MKKRGEISVFLILLLPVLSSFLIALIMNVRILVSRSEAAYAVDNAVMSCFAEYNKAVYSQFGILLIDSSYKSTDGGVDRVAEHFSTYLENSMSTNTVCDVNIDAVPVTDEYLYDAAMKYVEECEEDGSDPIGRFRDAVTDHARMNGSHGFDWNECFSRISFSVDLMDTAGNAYKVTREFSYEE